MEKDFKNLSLNVMLQLGEEKESRITSVDLVEIINIFRQLESKSSDKKYSELKHNHLMEKIRKEVKTLEDNGIKGLSNFRLSSYTNKQNKEQPCYSLNRDGMLQMLN